jgi:hypothetical protein
MVYSQFGRMCRRATLAQKPTRFEVAASTAPGDLTPAVARAIFSGLTVGSA